MAAIKMAQQTGQVTRSPDYHKWLVFVSSYITMVIAVGFFYSQAPLFVIIMRRFGSSRAETALIQSMNNTFMMATGIINGMLIHKVGARKAAMAGSLVVTVTLVVSSFATSVTYLIVSLGIILGMGLSPLFLSSMTAVGQHFEHSRYRAVVMSTHSTASGVGGMLYPYFVQYLDYLYGLPGITLIIAGLIFQTFACTLLWDKPVPPKKQPRIPHIEQPAETGVDNMKTIQNNSRAKAHADNEFELSERKSNVTVETQREVTVTTKHAPANGNVTVSKQTVGNGSTSGVGHNMRQYDNSFPLGRAIAKAGSAPAVSSNPLIIISTVNGVTTHTNNKSIEIVVDAPDTRSEGECSSVEAEIQNTYDNAVFDQTLADEKLGASTNCAAEKQLERTVHWNREPEDAENAGDIEHTYDTVSNAEHGKNETQTADKEKRDKITILQSMKFLARHNYFWTYSLGFAVMFPVFGSVVVLVADVFLDKGFTDSEAALSLVLLNVVSCVGRISTGLYIRVLHVPPLGLPAFAASIGMISLVGVAYMTSLAGCYVATCAFGFGLGTCVSCLSVTSMELFGVKHLSNCMGLLFTVSSVGNIVAIPLSGYIRDKTGSYTLPLLMSAGGCGVGVLLFAISHILSKGHQVLAKQRKPSIHVAAD